MHAISISNFPALLKKRERKKGSTPIWSKTQSFSEKPLWLFKFHPVSFKCQKLVLIFKHILFKWSCHQDPPSLSDLWKTPLCCVLWFKLWYWVKLIAPWETKGDYPDGLDRKMWPIMCGEKRLIKMSFKWTLLFFFFPEPLFAWSPPKTWIDQTHFIFPDYSPNWTIIEVCTTWSVI